MAEINVEFVNFGQTASGGDGILRPSHMLVNARSAASRAMVTASPLAGEDLIVYAGAPYTHALITARGADIRVAIGADPEAGQDDTLVQAGVEICARIQTGQSISAILDVALS